MAAPDLAVPRPPHPEILKENACKARYGVSYVRAIVSQAGLGFTETSPDEDAIAIDGTVDFDIAAVRVQIKCTSQYRLAGRSASWPMELHWHQSWSTSKVPVYFVLVMLDTRDRPAWLSHSAAGTNHRAAAYWVRVDQSRMSKSIKVTKTQRLGTDTFSEWYDDLCASFGMEISHAG